MQGVLMLCLTRCVLQKQYAVVQRYADDTQQMQHAALCVVAAAMQYLASLSCPAPLDCHPKTWGSLFVRGLDLYQHDSAVMQGWAVLDTAVRAWLPLVAIMAPDAQRQFRLALGAQALFVCADEEVTTSMFKYIALPHLRARIRPLLLALQAVHVELRMLAMQFDTRREASSLKARRTALVLAYVCSMALTPDMCAVDGALCSVPLQVAATAVRWGDDDMPTWSLAILVRCLSSSASEGVGLGMCVGPRTARGVLPALAEYLSNELDKPKYCMDFIAMKQHFDALTSAFTMTDTDDLDSAVKVFTLVYRYWAQAQVLKFDGCATFPKVMCLPLAASHCRCIASVLHFSTLCRCMSTVLQDHCVDQAPVRDGCTDRSRCTLALVHGHGWDQAQVAALQVPGYW
jgi:hypothetical protein